MLGCDLTVVSSDQMMFSSVSIPLTSHLFAKSNRFLRVASVSIGLIVLFFLTIEFVLKNLCSVVLEISFVGDTDELILANIFLLLVLGVSNKCFLILSAISGEIFVLVTLILGGKPSIWRFLLQYERTEQGLSPNILPITVAL